MRQRIHLIDQGTNMQQDGRNEIISATDTALTVRINQREAIVPWSIVTGVSAGRARLDAIGDQYVFVLALEMLLEGESRLFIVAETEPAWVSLTAALSDAILGIPPFEVWGRALITASAPIQLWQRPENEA